jgi:diacylglycerol kinase (ATP)
MQLEGKYMLVEVSNIRLYAGGFATLSPEARVDDGLMELWLFAGQSLEDILQQAWSLWSGKHIDSEKVQFVQFKKIILESDTPIYLQMDGEPEIGDTRVEVSVLHRQLKVIVPDRTPESLFQFRT